MCTIIYDIVFRELVSAATVPKYSTSSYQQKNVFSMTICVLYV